MTTVPQHLENSALSDDCHYRYNHDRAAQKVQDDYDSILTCRQNWAQHWLPDAGRAVPATTRTKANPVPQLWTHTVGSAPDSQRKQGLCPTLSLTLPARARTHLHARPPRRLRPLRPLPRGRPPPRSRSGPTQLSRGRPQAPTRSSSQTPHDSRPGSACPAPRTAALGPGLAAGRATPPPRSLRGALLRREQTPGRSRPSALGLRGRLPRSRRHSPPP